MENIKLTANLCVYSKGAIPSKIEQLEGSEKLVRKVEEPIENELYALKNNEWEAFKLTQIETPDNSGIKIDKEDNIVTISAKKFTGKEKDVITYKEDTTYYFIDEEPELYANGGTAFVEDEIQDITIAGGNANTSSFALNILPINSKGVYNG